MMHVHFLQASTASVQDDLTEVGGKAPTDFNKTRLGQHSGNLIHSDLLFAAWLTD